MLYWALIAFFFLAVAATVIAVREDAVGINGRSRGRANGLYLLALGFAVITAMLFLAWLVVGVRG